MNRCCQWFRFSYDCIYHNISSQMSDYVKRLRPRVNTGGKKPLLKTTINSLSRRSVLNTHKKAQVRKKAHQTHSSEMLDVVSPIMAEPPVSGFTESDNQKPIKTKIKTKKSKSQVHHLLSKAGVEDPESVCMCLKAGIKNGCVNFDIPKPLDQVLVRSKCYSCENDVVVRVRDVLYQGAVGGSYWNGYDDDILCSNPECEERFVVSDICTSHPELQDGKFYNHCEVCPGFGKCIGDFRHSHCLSCGDHYFAGSMGQCKCPTCYSTSEDDDDGLGFLGAFCSGKSCQTDTSIFCYIYKKLDYLRFDALRSDPDLIDTQAFRYILHGSSSSGSDTD